jgi:hypothetical protein
MSRIVIVGLTTLLPSMSRFSRQCGIPNISQPYRPPRPVTGIVLLLFLPPTAANIRLSHLLYAFQVVNLIFRVLVPLLQAAPGCWGGQRRASCWQACWCSWPATELLNNRSACWHLDWVSIVAAGRERAQGKRRWFWEIRTHDLGRSKIILSKSYFLRRISVSCYRANLPSFLK